MIDLLLLIIRQLYLLASHGEQRQGRLTGLSFLGKTQMRNLSSQTRSSHLMQLREDLAQLLLASRLIILRREMQDRLTLTIHCSRMKEILRISGMSGVQVISAMCSIPLIACFLTSYIRMQEKGTCIQSSYMPAYPSRMECAQMKS